MARKLYLEFKDGILNGYHYMSGFKNDKTEFDPAKINKIKINQSTQSDVLTLLNEPTGKAICPTTLVKLEEKCESGSEVWSWHKVNKDKYSLLFIVFNQKLVVTNFHLSEDQ